MTVSNHMLRRRARAKEQKLEQLKPAGARYGYRVVRASRGPWRWRVERV